jgi:CO/xanthine dehydrogenase FAD-binding subunit
VTPLETALAALAERPGLLPIAGCTDVMVAAPERSPGAAGVLDLTRLPELRGIREDGAGLDIGAGVTFTELRRSPEVRRVCPILAEAASVIGGWQIQNRATIGGNIVNASPAGDTLPLLLATDAEIVLGSATGERTVAAEKFWTGYRQTVRRDDELVTQVRIPVPADRQVRFRKVGTRRAQAISKVVMALAWRPDAGVWRDVRLGLGSVAATPIRARQTERVLEGAAPRAETADHAAATIAQEIEPIDDVRSTADYRRVVTARILHRLLREAGGW